MVDAPYPGAPRWARVFGLVAIVLALFVLAVVLTGGSHRGFSHHMSTGDTGGHSRWGLLILLGSLVVAGVAFNGRWLGAIGTASQRYEYPWRRTWPRARGWTLAMTPRIRKFALTTHVASSVGSLGSVAVFLALAIAGLSSQDAQLVRAAYIANGFIAWFVIFPLIFAALLTGLVQALGTPWGLFRHYWVLAKLLLTAVTIIVLLLQMEGIGYVADVAAKVTLSGDDLLGLRRSLRLHAAGGLLVLLLITALSIYKPRGMTRHGWRKQHEGPATFP